MTDVDVSDKVVLQRDFLNISTDTDGTEVRVTRDATHGMRFYVDGEQLVIEVKNDSGSTIAAGKPVYVSGTHSGSGKPLIALARADSSSTMPAIGLVSEDIADGEEGTVVAGGILKNLDTSAYSAGDALYVDPSSAGTLTDTRPTASTHLVQKVALVSRVHASNGWVIVMGAGRTNDISNDIVALTGVSLGSTNLGTFTGTTIADSETIKGALQDLETAVEATSVSTMLAVGTSTSSIANTTLYVPWDTSDSQALADADGYIRIDDEDSETDTSDSTIINLYSTARYQIDCSIRVNGNNRVESFVRIEVDPGTGTFARQNKHMATNYALRDGDQNTGSVTVSTILSLNSGDRLRFQAEADADGSADLLLNGTLLRIIRHP